MTGGKRPAFRMWAACESRAAVQFHQRGRVPSRVEPSIDRPPARIQGLIEEWRQDFIIRQAIGVDGIAILHDLGLGAENGLASEGAWVYEFDIP